MKWNISIIATLFVCFTISCGQPYPDRDSALISQSSSQEVMRTKLAELMQVSTQRPPAEELSYTKKRLSEEEAYTLYRVVIRLSPEDSIPAFLLTPKKMPPPYPVMICLQGHAPGMYISIGEQAVGDLSCNHVSLNLAMQGRPMLGKRVSDISCAIDFIETQDELQNNQIGCLGNSAGGTVSYFAACIDPRIQLAVVSCSFSTYEKSWLKYPHCACGYLPGLLEFADMPELAELIAPRHLLLIAGQDDYLADIEGVREGYQIARKLYQKYGVAERVVLAEGEGGHQFYPELAWAYIDHYQSSD